MNHKKTFSQIGLILFLGTLIIGVVQSLFIEIGKNIPFIHENGDLSFIISMLPMYIIAYPLIFLMFKALPVTMEGEKKKMKPSHILISFSIAYAISFFCNIVGNIITSIIGILKGGTVENVLANITGNIHPLSILFIIVICAPIMEELLFRKVLISRTSQYGEGVSLVLSGLVFGLFHGNLNQFAYAFLLGIFFGFLYVKTKNIIYPIIIHMLINFLGSFLSSILNNKTRYMEYTVKLQELQADPALNTESAMADLMAEYGTGVAIFNAYSFALFIFVIIGAILFFKNRNKFTLQAGEITIEKGKRFTTLFINLGMILYCAIWIITIITQLFA